MYLNPRTRPPASQIQAIFGLRESGGANRKLVSQFFLELDSVAGDMGVVVLGVCCIMFKKSG
jgi:hypothetical protein